MNCKIFLYNFKNLLNKQKLRTVWVAIDVSDLPNDLASACGIDKSTKLLVRLTFRNPPMFLSEKPSPEKKKSLYIRATPSNTDFKNLVEKDLYQFGLWWTLEQRMNEYFNEKWESLVEKAIGVEEKISELSDDSAQGSVLSLMEIMGLKKSEKQIAAAAL